MEKRPWAKGNPEQTAVTDTQRSETVLNELDRVREATSTLLRSTRGSPEILNGQG